MATIQARKASNGEIHYRVMVRLKGRPPEYSTFARKTDAKRWAAETETAIRQGKHFASTEAKRHTFGEMIDRYVRDVLPKKKQKSQHSQGPQLRWWKSRLGRYTLADVSPPMIAEARDALASEITKYGTPRAPSSVVRFLAALSHCYTIALKEWQWVQDNPVRRISKPAQPEGRVRFLSDDERARLLAACRESRNRDLYLIVMLALTTGMRKAELLGITWDAVDLNRGLVTLRITKNKQTRAVPLVGQALELMRERARIRRIDTPLVFARPHYPGKEAKPIGIQAAWESALQGAGIENFHFHDLRHTAASYLLMSGASPGELAEILGHKTLQMVRRYSHISQPHATALVERMAAKYFGNGD